MYVKTILLIFGVFTIAVCKCGPTVRHWKDYTYKEETDSFYKYHDTPKSWKEAKEICESEDALLFYPNNKEEARLIKDWIQTLTPGIKPTQKNFPFTHIGVTDARVEGQFETVDGIPISQVYHEWAPGEPDNRVYTDVDEDCGQLYYDLTINDSKCSSRTGLYNEWYFIPFICKKKLKTETKNLSGPTVPHWKDYTYKEETDSFYKYHDTPKSWKEAKEVCESEDSLLFYPNNKEEARLIKNWIQTLTPGIKLTQQNFPFTHIGVTDARVEGQFETVDGIPISQVYHEWAPGEPDNRVYTDVDEDCGQLYYDLTINDSKCSSRTGLYNEWYFIPFICKKKLKTKTNNLSGPTVPHWKDYTYKEETDSFYKYHDTPKSWKEAKEVCESEDSLLFYPNNKEEARLIKNWIQTLTPGIKLTQQNFPFTHIGVTDARVEGQFETVDGIPISQVYHEWAPGEPDNRVYTDVDEDCGQLYYDLTINDSKCSSRTGLYNEWYFIPFICKKKLKTITNNLSKPARQDYTYKQNFGSFYKIYNTRTTWLEAKATCESEDALLFYPENREEAEMIKTWWGDYTSDDVTPRHASLIHLGLTDAKNEGHYETVDGIPMSRVYHNWSPGEPNGGRVENCAHLLYDLTINDSYCDGSVTGPWNEWYIIPFVCKKKITNNTTPGEPNKQKKIEVYKYIEETQNFYKIHNTETSWIEAEKICRDEGAILFHPGSTLELNVVRRWWRNCTDGATCLEDNSSIHVGLTDAEGEGQFKTVDGIPISEVYHKWLQGQPDNSDKGIREDCVHLRSDLTLNDIDCNGIADQSKYPFICKLKRTSFNRDSNCNKTNIGELAPQHWRDYVYIEKSRNFYKIHNIRTTWLDAKAACEAEDALLFYPENKEEAEMIKEWWGESTSDDMTTRHASLIHLGLTDAKLEGYYETVDGIPISSVYHNWGPGEPNGGEYEDCAHLLYDLTINDSRCDGSYDGPWNEWYFIPFICKKKIKCNSKNQGELLPAHRNGYTYKDNFGSFYKIHDTRTTWLEAKATCEAEDALLFYPENREEAEMMKTWWGDYTSDDVTPRHASLIHIGLTDAKSEGNYVTVDEIPMSKVYNNWSPGEPNGGRGENCAHLLYDLTINDSLCEGSVTGPWDEWYIIPFVCKKKIPNNITSGQPNKQKKVEVYKYIEETQNFYKIHNTETSWIEAEKICRDEGAILFHPGSTLELNVVRRWWRNCTDGATCLEDNSSIHVGLTDAEVEGQFKTLDGIPISQVYHKWLQGQPDNNDKGIREDCVQLRSDLTLNDIDCNGIADQSKYPFICKLKRSSFNRDSNCNTPYSGELVPHHWRDYTYIEKSRNFYKIHNTRMTWLEAKAKCELEDALLFYPENREEAGMIKTWWAESTSDDITPRHASLIHLGLTDTKSEGHYETVDGIPMSKVYHNWSPGEPNGGRGENCAHLLYDLTINDSLCEGSVTGPWNEWYIIPFVCKKKLKCDTNNSGTTHDTGLSNYYAFHLQPLNWTDAEAACAAEQSHLAVINSQLEADHLKTLTANASTQNVTGRFLRGAVHLGFHNMDDAGWKTVTGTKLEESGYAVWGYQQPDGKGREKCGSMFYSGRLNDIHCSAKCFYICEREHDI